MNIEINKSGSTEIDPLVDILSAATKYKLAHGDSAWGSEPFTKEEVVTDLDKDILYTVKLNGEVKGTFKLIWEDPEIWGEQPPDSGYIHQIAIKEDSHGQGLGEYLLNWASEEVKHNNRKYLRLDCPANNQGLCNYYEKCGFIKVGILERPLPDWPDYSAALYQKEV